MTNRTVGTTHSTSSPQKHVAPAEAGAQLDPGLRRDDPCARDHACADDPCARDHACADDTCARDHACGG